MKSFIPFSLFCLAVISLQAQNTRDYLQYVDPNIGTAHCRWFHYTPGALPFGMAKPAPSTNGSYGNPSGWEATGYDYRHTSIEGFGNIHEFQVGGIVFAPITGALQTIPGKLEDPASGYRSTFERKDEIAKPGYYSVLLKDYQIKAELTATSRVAFHRYTFPAGKESHIIFDIGNRQGESGPAKDAKVSILPDGRIEGYVTTLPAYVQKYQKGSEVTMYFSAVVSKQPTESGVFKGEEIFKGRQELNGVGAGAWLTFSTTEHESIVVKAGLSYTSIENARVNLEKEAANVSFDDAVASSAKSWNEYLGRIDVTSGNKSDLTKFYTGLYHAVLGRGLASDINGAYPKNDGTVGQIPLDATGKPKHNHYNTDAVWGTYWNLNQLWALAYPEYYSDFIQSQLLVYKDAGWLGDGIANSRYVSGVGTNMVSLVLAAAYMTGIRDFDVKLGYEAALKNELEWRDRPRGAGKLDIDRFIKYGYVNHLDTGNDWHESWQFSASHTLEYAFSAYGVAQWAKLLNKTADYNKLIKLSAAWEKIFDPSLKLIHPKTAEGKFIDKFDPSQPWRGFQEGNAWQYTYFVPHQPRELVAKLGKNTFNKRLDSTFTIAKKAMFGGGANIDAFAGIAGIYNHGNQPNLHASWLFNFSGKPSLTQRWVREICNDFYGTEGIHGYGYGQDEDQGQLGAWYVMSSIGLFDVKGLAEIDPSFGIGSPLFDRVVIKLNPKYYKGKQFEIVAKGGGSDAKFIQRMKHDGKVLHQPFVKFADVVKGGKFEMELGERAVDEY